MHRTPGDVEIRHFFVKKARQEPHQPALRLAFLAQEQKVVARDQADIDFRDNRVLVTDDPREKLLAVAEHAHEIVVDLPLDGAGNPTAFAKLAQGGGSRDDQTR